MILLAGEGNLVLPDAHDRGDDTDLETLPLEHIALLDVRFEVTHVTVAIDALAGRAPALEPCAATGPADAPRAFMNVPG